MTAARDMADDKGERVVAAARAWLGTPYHDQQSVRGVGCDCLGLARGVWRELVGPEPFPIPPYSRDWGEAGPDEVLADAFTLDFKQATNRAGVQLKQLAAEFHLAFDHAHGVLLGGLSENLP